MYVVKVYLINNDYLDRVCLNHLHKVQKIKIFSGFVKLMIFNTQQLIY
ncbi:hypothetical protein PRJ_Fausto_00496 [Faustovirus]|nr:hypothetical protein PRJ_Fausto_00496 [Faustovirus]